MPAARAVPSGPVAPHPQAMRGRPGPRGRADALAPGRILARLVLFYSCTALFLLASVAAHEYSHYAVHEGAAEAPPVRFHSSVASANDALVPKEGAAPGELESTIVFLPSTAVQSLTMGLLPADAHPDGGVLALTYLAVDDGHPRPSERGGPAWSSVEGAPVTLALACLAASFAWVAWSRSLPARSALLASAVALGNTRHHMAALGVPPARMELLTWTALAAALLVAVLAGSTFQAWVRRRRPSSGGASPAASRPVVLELRRPDAPPGTPPLGGRHAPAPAAARGPAGAEAVCPAATDSVSTSRRWNPPSVPA